MSLKVEWNGGVAVQYGETRIVFDPQVNSPDGYPNVFVTHAHLDHAKGFNSPEQVKYSTKETYDLFKAVEGREISNWNQVLFHRKVKIDDLEIEALNAGHILGSAQYRVSSPEGDLVYTGDLNFVDTLTMRAAEVSPCDVLVIEATFGSPEFAFPPREQVCVRIVQWAVNSIKRKKLPVFQTDSMGNAQELVRIFNALTTVPVITHQRVTRINRVYETHGHALDYLDAESEGAAELMASTKCVFIVPKRLSALEKKGFNVAYASGWASHLKGERKAFTLSDHADFRQLLKFVEESGTKLVLTCHGGRLNETFAKYVNKRVDVDARPLRLIPTVVPLNMDT